MTMPAGAWVRTEIVQRLVEQGVIAATVYPDKVEISGGTDSDDVLFSVEGSFTRKDVARWLAVDPARIVVDGETPEVGRGL